MQKETFRVSSASPKFTVTTKLVPAGSEVAAERYTEDSRWVGTPACSPLLIAVAPHPAAWLLVSQWQWDGHSSVFCKT